MALEQLIDALREEAGPRVWGAAVKLAREGGVVGVGEDEGEIHLRVKRRGKALPVDVWLFPDDVDWDADVDEGDGLVYAVAAALAVKQGYARGEDLPTPQKQFRVRLRYALTTVGRNLALERQVVWPDGRVQPLQGTLADNDLLATRGDAQVETLLAMHAGGPLPGEMARRLLRFLEGQADATLDGQPVELSNEDVFFQVRVSDDGDAFKVGLYRPPGIDKLYRGVALVGRTLHPTSHGDLSPAQRKQLIGGVIYASDDVGRLVRDVLPRLEQRIPVSVETDRLPGREQLQPRVALRLDEVPLGLKVEAWLEYGDPPVARIENGVLHTLGDVVPARDLGRERVTARKFEALTGVPVGVAFTMPPGKAAAFLTDTLPLFDGPVRGRVDRRRFEIVHDELVPQVAVRPATALGARSGGVALGPDGEAPWGEEVEGGHPSTAAWALDVRFQGDQGAADPLAVLEAWRAGRSLVPLMEGGFAPLPKGWLETHGAVLRELLEARDGQGRVGRNATAALVELLEGVDHDVPPDLSRLRTFLEGGEGLPEAELPAGFTGELRPYQVVGFRWLAFLRAMDLGGILADDMGLGKTIQALAAIAHAGGRSLVVAPTSVLRNWEREAARFVPNLRVNVYHGPNRTLDPAADLTLTSYALLRLDLDRLRDHDWAYLVLDEAQAIKNASSQTARAACALPSAYRLALTGTPVENRLEELWSLFRFLMPGLLGSQEAFRDRFVKPLEAGDGSAGEALHRRVRPYVLRRLKQQVAPELPPITEVVVRCEMSPAQRKVYDAVRLAARQDVQRAIQERGKERATFQVLEALLRMRQAACDPGLLPGDAGGGAASAKLDRLEEMLVDVLVDGHKALIFSQWTSLLDRVQPRLAGLGIDYVRLDGATRDRQGVIDRFQSDDGPPVFLLSLKAGGTGLNLTAADYVIILDPWWNPAVEQQAIDRAHRIGQERPVVSCRYIAEGTVEERILDLQEAKRGLADAALGTEGGFLRALDAAELRSLFEGAT